VIDPPTFARPRLGISRCIEFDHCRYNGEMIGSEIVRRLKEHADFAPVCPEAEIGLGIPRDPIRIVLKGTERRLVQPSTGRDVTDNMTVFSHQFLEELGEMDGFILKSRSPSCGVRDVRVYPDKQGAIAINKGSGLFGGEVLDRLRWLPVEDEARLRNIKLGEHFLTGAFTLASFRGLKAAEMVDLIAFHSRNKLLLMMYSQQELKILGNIVANRDGRSVPATVNAYRDHLRSALHQPPRCNAPINVLMHALGYFSGQLKKEEKAFFLETLRMYRDSRVPLSVCLNLMRSYIIRFGNEYLEAQTFFRPFPEGILEVGITDSCDWREMSV
jgi:uncharacterized protein YbgA (DUF1722 family)/uncharacterized protein YbbK (DUF523 family)